MSSTAQSTTRQFHGAWNTWQPTGNHYGIVATSGAITALAAGATLFSFRGPSTGVVYVTSLRTMVLETTVFDFTRLSWIDGYLARSFTASDSGGLTFTLTGNNCKSQTGDVTTGVQDIRIANTGTLTAGTRTLDTSPNFNGTGILLQSAAVTSAQTNAGTIGSTETVILGANEGIVLTTRFAFPATGVITLVIIMQWQELPNW